MDALTLLADRNSALMLTEPAPDRENLDHILRAALRVPDHGRLHPTRFIVVEGEARARLGLLYDKALLARTPTATEGEREKALGQPQRAPMIVVVAAHLVDHLKVPKIEQLLTAGCSAHAMLYAAEALGYGAIWRTGDNAYDPMIKAGLGLSAEDAIIGFLYLGSKTGAPKPIPRPDPGMFTSYWDGVGD